MSGLGFFVAIYDFILYLQLRHFKNSPGEERKCQKVCVNSFLPEIWADRYVKSPLLLAAAGACIHVFVQEAQTSTYTLRQKSEK